MRLLGTAWLFASIFLAGCDFDEFDSGHRVKEDFHHSYTLKQGGRVELEGFNGSVEIRGWDRETVEIDGTKTASSDTLLQEIKIDIANSDDSVRIRAIRPQVRRGSMGVSFVLSVPRKVLLERIQSSNGGIRVSGVEGNARLRSSNGSIKVSSFKGDLDAVTSNSGVELSEFSGGATLHTSNGSIRAEGVRGFLEATTSNASIDARVIETAGGRPIRVQSSNGRVVLAVESLKDSDVRASTSNSSVTVKLPASANARVRASTSNSSIDSEFDVSTRGSISKNRLEGTIGSGGPLVDLQSSNGSIRIQRL